MLRTLIFLNYVVTTVRKDDTNLPKKSRSRTTFMILILSFINVVSHYRFSNFIHLN